MNDTEKQAEAETTVAVPAATQDTLLAEFLAYACATIASDIREHQMRVTKHGLFVAEELLGQILQKYGPWFQEKTGHGLSAQKVEKRLLGEDEPTLYYLIERKSCIAGYLIACPGLNHDKLNVPFFLGSLSSAADSIHPRDPKLQTLSGVEAVVDDQGFRLQLPASGGRLTVLPERIASFAPAIRSFLKHGLHQVEQPRTGRDLVLALAKLVQRMRPVTKDQSFLAPLVIEGRATLLRWKAVVAVVSADATLQSLYELRGRGFTIFLENELALLAQKIRGERIPNFTAHRGGRPGSDIGEYAIGPDQYSLSSQALTQFALGIPREIDGSVVFHSPYTIRELFLKFIELLKSSTFVDAARVPQLVRSASPREAGFRQNKEWYFSFFRSRERYVIDGCKNSQLLAISNKGQPSAPPRNRQRPARGRRR